MAQHLLFDPGMQFSGDVDNPTCTDNSLCTENDRCQDGVCKGDDVSPILTPLPPPCTLFACFLLRGKC